MSILSETLKELIDESNLDYKTIATQIGISASRITDYIKNEKLPTVQTLIKIADYFGCSIDYLLGKTYDDKDKVFCSPVPFGQRLVYLEEFYHLQHKDIYNKDGISKSRYFEWLNGKRQPTIENLIKLAEIFNCSIDFVIGREN